MRYWSHSLISNLAQSCHFPRRNNWLYKNRILAKNVYVFVFFATFSSIRGRKVLFSQIRTYMVIKCLSSGNLENISKFKNDHDLRVFQNTCKFRENPHPCILHIYGLVLFFFFAKNVYIFLFANRISSIWGGGVIFP